MAQYLAQQGLTRRQLKRDIGTGMVDIFALSVPHAILALAIWRILQRDDLDTEVAADSDPAEPHA
jgi:hypothetical protein